MTRHNSLQEPGERATRSRTTVSTPPSYPPRDTTANSSATQTRTNQAHKPRTSPSVKNFKTKSDNLEHPWPVPDALVNPVTQYSPSVTHKAQHQHSTPHATIPGPDNQTHKEITHKSKHTSHTIDPPPHRNKSNLGLPPLPQHKTTHPRPTPTPVSTTIQTHPPPKHALLNLSRETHEPKLNNPPSTTTNPTNKTHALTLDYLIAALHTHYHHQIKTLIQHLPTQWSCHNAAGTLITRRQLIQSSWGELQETDSLQSFQQAIITTFPPPTTTVTQYHAQLTSAICLDRSVWQLTIRNACQDQILPHPLSQPITIFNIHHNSHFTTLITNNHTYYHYDPLNLQPPKAIDKIHTTLRQWYTGLDIAPPSCATKRPTSTYKVPPSKRTAGHVACTCFS